MNENMKLFLQTVSENEELQRSLSFAGSEEIIAAARELGIMLTDQDFQAQVAVLSDDELDTVAGGGICACVLGGGGKEDKTDKTCACVLGGGGEDRNGWARCVCIMGGNGVDNRAMED